jgi:hypothetical protein
MQYPDLHHLARDRIIAAGLMKLDMHEAELSAARGEPGVIETRKPRQAASNPAKRALACASRRSPTLGRVTLVAPVSRTRTAALRRARLAPEDAALYRCPSLREVLHGGRHDLRDVPELRRRTGLVKPNDPDLKPTRGLEPRTPSLPWRCSTG